MADIKEMPKIALGAWAWGNDGTFGGNLTAESLRPVFDAAMKAGLNLWDTAYVYGMGTSEKILGDFLRTVPRDSYLISDKFTPQCADPAAENAVTALYEKSAELGKIADRHHVAIAQIPVAWAIAKGTLPIIGVTKVYQVEDVVKAMAVELSEEEIRMLENLGDEAQLPVIRYWEKEMK